MRAGMGVSASHFERLWVGIPGKEDRSAQPARKASLFLQPEPGTRTTEPRSRGQGQGSVQTGKPSLPPSFPRVISRAQGLKLVVETLMSSLKPIGNIVVICCAFFIIFGILGVQVCGGLGINYQQKPEEWPSRPLNRCRLYFRKK